MCMDASIAAPHRLAQRRRQAPEHSPGADQTGGDRWPALRSKVILLRWIRRARCGGFPSPAPSSAASQTVSPVENRSYHYHRTVDQWLQNFEAHWPRIQAIDPVRFNEKFRRTWLFYLAGACETFAADREIINCFHITFVKGHFTRGPLHPEENRCPTDSSG